MEWWEEAEQQPEDLSAVLQKHQDDFRDSGGVYGNSPVQRAWNYQLLRAARLAKAEGWSTDQLELHLDAAHNLLHSIRYSIIANLDSLRSPTQEEALEAGVLFQDFGGENLRLSRLNQVDKRLLDENLTSYLQTPSLACGAFDWIFVNAYLRYWIADFYYAVIIRSEPWLHAVSGGQPGRIRVWRFVGTTTGFTVNWLLLPAAAAYALFSDHMNWAIGIGALFMVMVLLRLIAIPASLERRRARRKRARVLHGMMTLHNYATDPVWNPTDLLALVREFDAEFRDFPLTPVTAILARAVDRDPNVLARDVVEGEHDWGRPRP